MGGSWCFKPRFPNQNIKQETCSLQQTVALQNHLPANLLRKCRYALHFSTASQGTNSARSSEFQHHAISCGMCWLFETMTEWSLMMSAWLNYHQESKRMVGQCAKECVWSARTLLMVLPPDFFFSTAREATSPVAKDPTLPNKTRGTRRKLPRSSRGHVFAFFASYAGIVGFKVH